MNSSKIGLKEQVYSYARAILRINSDHPLTLLEWIPVEERLPESVTNIETSNTCFFVAVNGLGKSTVTTGRYDWREKYKGWRWTVGGRVAGDGWRVTHWAEIPQIEETQ